MDTTPGIEGGVQAPEAGGQRRPLAAAILVAVLFVAMIGLSIWYLTRPEPLVIQGEVQSRSFDMAARVDGRIARILVARSEDVHAGAPLLRIENPELLARLRQNEAELAVARAELARVEAGFRSETVAVRRAQVDRAAADLTLAQQTYDRVRQLAADRFAPRAQLD
jgi:HlyD family secretion protein